MEFSGEISNLNEVIEMNLVNMNSEMKMSSREIAELTGKQHKNVLRDVREMYDSLGLEQGSNLSFDHSGANGKRVEFYMLGRELTMTLVTGYSVKLRNAVIRRWQELEQQAAQPKIEFTLEQALQIALDKERENKQLTAINTQQAEKLEADAPKVESHQRLMDSNGTFSNAVAAKSVGAGVRRLLGRLRAHDHVFKHNALPKQHLIDRGLCKVVTNKEGYSSIRWTPKGLDWVTKFYAESSKSRPNQIIGELPFKKKRAVPMTKRFH